jgi:hypothetical protein
MTSLVQNAHAWFEKNSRAWRNVRAKHQQLQRKHARASKSVRARRQSCRKRAKISRALAPAGSSSKAKEQNLVILAIHPMTKSQSNPPFPYPPCPGGQSSMTTPESGGRLRAYWQFLVAVIYFFMARSLAHRAAVELASDRWYPACRAGLSRLPACCWATPPWGSGSTGRCIRSRSRDCPGAQGWPGEAGLGLATGWGLGRRLGSSGCDRRRHRCLHLDARLGLGLAPGRGGVLRAGNPC